MAIFTTLSVVIWFSTGTLGIFATLVYAFTTRVVICHILSMAIIPTLSTSILFCNLCYTGAPVVGTPILGTHYIVICLGLFGFVWVSCDAEVCGAERESSRTIQGRMH